MTAHPSFFFFFSSSNIFIFVSVCVVPVSPFAARYCLSGLPVDCQMKNITNPDQTSLLLEDLIIWTNYEIEVAAYNGAGRGTYSHKVTEWTLQGGEGSTHCNPKEGLPAVQAAKPRLRIVCKRQVLKFEMFHAAQLP